MNTPKPDSMQDNIDTAQGAVPFGYDSAPSSEGPMHHPIGAVNPDLPGKDQVDFASVAPEKNPPRPERKSWQTTPVDDDGTPAWIA